jgi:VIT1/CCC1 family predicted Fe2+/Mn2+ transporter
VFLNVKKFRSDSTHPKAMSENLPNLSEFNEIVGNDKSFVLRIVQPGLAGLMDGSVSTLAPIFATAFATHNSRTVFLIGAASAVGAGISMAFSEGLSDDGSLTGRGNPVFRGLVTGFMTFIGGFLHTLPFLIPNVHTALTWAYGVVGVELVVIALIRHRYFKTSFATLLSSGHRWRRASLRRWSPHRPVITKLRAIHRAAPEPLIN